MEELETALKNLKELSFYLSDDKLPEQQKFIEQYMKNNAPELQKIIKSGGNVVDVITTKYNELKNNTYLIPLLKLYRSRAINYPNDQMMLDDLLMILHTNRADILPCVKIPYDTFLEKIGNHIL